MTTAVHSRRAIRGRGDDAGFTVVEMAITVMLLGIVSFVMFNFLTNATSITNRASKDLQAEQKMTLALRTMTQDLRSASSVTACTAVSTKTCLVLEIPRSVALGISCPQRVITYKLTGGVIQEAETDYPAAACSPTTTKFTARPLLSSVVNDPATQPLFTFFDTTGVQFDPDVTTKAIASIKTSVSVDYGINNAPKLSLSSIAALRNAQK
jgi:type II secretory pathway pseudopilin PulG